MPTVCQGKKSLKEIKCYKIDYDNMKKVNKRLKSGRLVNVT